MNTSYHNIPGCAAYSICDTIDAIMNFTTISNASSSDFCAVGDDSIDYSIKNCNYLYNKYTGYDNAIIYCYRSTKYTNCAFIENKGDYLFVNQPIINKCYFYNNQGELVRVDPDGSVDSIGPIKLNISHYAVEGCSTISKNVIKKINSKGIRCGKIIQFLKNYSSAFMH